MPPVAVAGCTAGLLFDVAARHELLVEQVEWQGLMQHLQQQLGQVLLALFAYVRRLGVIGRHLPDMRDTAFWLWI
jgi:hypothetical protein